MLRMQLDISSADSRMDLDSEELDRLTNEAEILLELFSSDGFTATLNEARQFMIALEQQFIRVHAQAMASLEGTELGAVFEDLARQDRAHLASLSNLL